MDFVRKNDVLNYVKSYLPTACITVEAGAFNGKDTLILSNFWPQGTVHAFEPVPDIFQLLQNNTIMCPNVHCYPYALSDTNGHSPFHVARFAKNSDNPCPAGSLLRPKERLALSDITYTEVIQVPTITLDRWSEHYAVDRVDFLWLDMQGFALNVLKASPRILSKAKVLYLEVEFVEAYQGQYQYEEVKSWLQKAGFTMIARDFTDNPTWFFGDALFVRTPL